MADDPFAIGGTSFSSRLIMGTGGRPAWMCSSEHWSPPAPS